MRKEPIEQGAGGEQQGLVTEQAYDLRRGMREKEAAEYLGVSIKTLQAWRFQCRGPKYSKMGRACVYTKQWCDEFRDAGVVVPVGAAR
jgi:hypothetical protein